MSRVQSDRRLLEWQSRRDDRNTSCDIYPRSNCDHDQISQIATRITIRTVGVLDLISRVSAGFVFYPQIMRISCKWDVNFSFPTCSFTIVIRELSWTTVNPSLQRRDIYTLIQSRTIRIYLRIVLNASIKKNSILSKTHRPLLTYSRDDTEMNIFRLVCRINVCDNFSPNHRLLSTCLDPVRRLPSSYRDRRNDTRSSADDNFIAIRP